jgi:AcrR family transcriptional regulator
MPAQPSADRLPAGAAATRERIVVAAHALIREVGIRRLSMSEVAAAAGLSRAALYKHFPDKRSLVDAVLVRNGHLIREELDRALASATTLADQCVVAVRLGLTPPGELRLLELHDSDPEALAQLLTTGAAPFLERATRFWAPHVAAAQQRGEVRHDLDPAEAAEWIARSLYALAVTPPLATDLGDAAALERYVRRYVVGALAA